MLAGAQICPFQIVVRSGFGARGQRSRFALFPYHFFSHDGVAIRFCSASWLEIKQPVTQFIHWLPMQRFEQSICTGHEFMMPSFHFDVPLMKCTLNYENNAHLIRDEGTTTLLGHHSVIRLLNNGVKYTVTN